MMTRFIAAIVSVILLSLTTSAGDFIVPPYKVVNTLKATELQTGDVVDWALPNIGIPDAHAKGVTGKGVRIAVLDTGVAGSHPDLAGQLDFSKDFTGSPTGARDMNGHGTWCVGRVVAAKNGAGMLGGAFGAKAGIFKVLGDDGSGNFDWFNAAVIEAADKGYHCLTASLGAASDPGQATFDAIKYATNKGMLVFLAAGNEGPGANTVGWPAHYAEQLPVILCVAAHDVNNVTASFSSRGAAVTITAGGVNTRSTWLNGQFANLDGTSMATPTAASLGCLWMEAAGLAMAPNADRPKAFLKALIESCDTYPARTTSRGYGRPNAVKMLGPVAPPPIGTPFLLSDTDLTPTAKLRLTTAGIGAFTLSVTRLPDWAGVPQVPTPPAQSAVPQTAAPIGKRWVKHGPLDGPQPWVLEDSPPPAPMSMPSTGVPPAMSPLLPQFRQQFQQLQQRCVGPKCPK